MFTSSKRQMLAYKLVDENARRKDFPHRAKKKNIRTNMKERGWNVVDKDVLKKGMNRDREEQSKKDEH
jgi:hypothetical protein